MPDFHQGTLVITQPPHFPTMHTRETVTHLAAFGLDENQVAVILKCTADDVRRYYMTEMEHGLTLVNSRVMSAVLHQALYKEDVTAMKLWLINKAGWRAGDNAKLQIQPPNTGEGVGPDGELTVVQRREVITRLLVKGAQLKRQQEHVIEGELVPAKKNGNGANGHAKTNGANGKNGKHE